MGIFASHGSRQCPDEPQFRTASSNLNDRRGGGGSPSRDSTCKPLRSFTLFLCFRPFFPWSKREEGLWKSQTTRPSYGSRVPFFQMA